MRLIKLSKLSDGPVGSERRDDNVEIKFYDTNQVYEKIAWWLGIHSSFLC